MRPAGASEVEISIPEELPFLESISWLDRLWRDLSPLASFRSRPPGLTARRV